MINVKTWRFDNIDLLETIAIFFVIFYHTKSDIGLKPTEGFDIFCGLKMCWGSILSICCPLFFFCNGFLLFGRPLDVKKHLIKTIRLFVLAIIWATISAVYSQYIIHSVEPVGLKDLVGIILRTMSPWNNHIWFLQTMVILYAIFPFLKLAFDNSKQVFYYGLTLTATVVLGGSMLAQVGSLFSNHLIEDVNIFGPYTPVTMGMRFSLLYFLVGGAVYANLRCLHTIKLSKWGLVLILLIVSYLQALYGDFIVRTGAYYDVVWFGYASLASFIITACVFLLSLNYKDTGHIMNKFVYLVSTNTLGIYFLQDLYHKAFQVYGRPFLSRYDLIDDYSEKFIVCTMILILSLLTSICMKKIPLLK